MMKRRKTAALAVVLVLALSLGLAACGNDSGSSNTPASPAESEAPSTFSFTLSMHDPITTPNAIFFQEWADAVNAATNGRVTITIHGSATLAAATDVADVVRGGGADMGWLFSGNFAGQFPLSEVISLPLQGFGDPVVSTRVLWDLYEEFEDMRAEWADFQLLMLYANPGMIFASAGDPITSVADISGKSLRSPAGPITSVLSAWGANPMMMPAPDIYQALERNNISGYVFEPAGITNFNLQEITDYFTDMPMYNGSFGLIMNKDKWASLPADLQEIIYNLSSFDASLRAAQNFADSVENARGIIIDAGGEFVSVTPEAMAEFQIEADIFADGWADGIGGAVDATAYLARARVLAAQHG